MNCPHCHQPLDSAQIRKALNKDLAGRKRPGAKGLIRNPKGRPPNAICEHCSGTKLISGQQCGWCVNKRPHRR